MLVYMSGIYNATKLSQFHKTADEVVWFSWSHKLVGIQRHYIFIVCTLRSWVFFDIWLYQVLRRNIEMPDKYIKFALLVLWDVAKPWNQQNALSVERDLLRLIYHLYVRAVAEYVNGIYVGCVLKIRIVVSADQIQFPVFCQRLHKLQRNVNRICIQQRTAVKPIACEYYIFYILFIRCFYYRFARIYTNFQPWKLVPRQAAMQIREYYSFALKYIHILNITTLEQTSAD